MVRPEVFQKPTEEQIVKIIVEESWEDDWGDITVDTDRIASRVFEEIIAPLHRQWADQVRVEGDKR